MTSLPLPMINAMADASQDPSLLQQDDSLPPAEGRGSGPVPPPVQPSLPKGAWGRPASTTSTSSITPSQNISSSSSSVAAASSSSFSSPSTSAPALAQQLAAVPLTNIPAKKKAPVVASKKTSQFAAEQAPISDENLNSAVAAAIATATASSSSSTFTSPVATASDAARLLADGTWPLEVIVLDTGSIVNTSGMNAKRSSNTQTTGWALLTALIAKHGPKLKFATVPQVMQEIKDKQSKNLLSILPFHIEVLSPSEDSLREVWRFAKLTGDARALSATDLTVLALQLDLERRIEGKRFIRSEPQKKRAMDTTSGEKLPASTTTDTSSTAPSTSDATSPVASTDQENDEKDAADDADNEAEEAAKLLNGENEADNKDTTTSAPESSNIDDSNPEAALAALVKQTESAISIAEKKTESKQPEDEEGEWITPDNLYHQKEFKANQDRIRAEALANPESRVGIITLDYAMQNLLLQMGLRLISIRGRTIKSLRSTQLKCHACDHIIINDPMRQFCPACGHHTLIRVYVTINRAGRVRYWHGTSFLNTRGTVYSIPKPIGGREGAAKNLKLSEDVMPSFLHKTRAGKDGKLSSNELFDLGLEFGINKAGRGHLEQFGYGRKNPNEVKHRGNNRRKKGRN